MAADDLDDDRLWEQYGHVLDEYRFQVDLNWKRSQYYFVLVVAVLAASGALLTASAPVPDGVVALLFGAGAGIALMAILANATGHRYYRSTRALKKRIEYALGLDGYAIKPTVGMGSRLGRIGRVSTFQTVMLVALGVANAVGCVVALASRSDADAGAKPSVLLVSTATVVDSSERSLPARLVVFSRGSRIVSAARPSSGGEIQRRLSPGLYQVALLRGRICQTTLRMSPRPLQVARLRCRIGS